MVATRQKREGRAAARELLGDFQEPEQELRRLLAELTGTFALTAVAAGGEVVAAVAGAKEVTPAARAVAPGLLVMAMIFALSDVSGAHFNPAVTLGFAARGGFAWRRVPGYWAAQLIGAVLSALMLRLTFGHVAQLGATQPHHGTASSLVMEVFLTVLLVTVILGTSTRIGRVGTNAAIAVGGTIALAGLIAQPISGASMNPARSLGPALVAPALSHVWLYLIGPAAGAAIAVAAIRTLQGPPSAEEARAETGQGDRGRG